MSTPDAAQPPGFETSAPVHPLIAARWSPRNLDPNAEVTPTQLRSALEAARWAPSWGGTSPARFVAGLRGSGTHSALADLLTRGNAWAGHAGALVLGAAAESNEKGQLTHPAYDLGAAVAQLQLQATADGLVTHPMAGFDAERAVVDLELPEGVRPWVVVAIGHPAGTAPGSDPRDPELVARLEDRDRQERRRPPFDDLVSAAPWGTPFS